MLVPTYPIYIYLAALPHLQLSLGDHAKALSLLHLHQLFRSHSEPEWNIGIKNCLA